MFETVFLFVLALAWIVFATVQDIRTREIANWLSFSLIIFALGFRFFYSLFFAGNFAFFLQGLIGLGIFFVIGNLFYYGKLFAGGDAKLLIALGAVLPLSSNLVQNLGIFFLFIITFLISGAIYGIFVSVVLCARNYKRFKKEFRKQARANKRMIYLFIAAGIAFLVLGYIDTLFFFLGIISFLFAYFYPYAKAVDESAMVKKVDSSKLREGDWLYQDTRAGKKMIKANWVGLTKAEIISLKKTKKQVVIREGIAFTPVFLISFLVFFYLWSKGLGNSFW